VLATARVLFNFKGINDLTSRREQCYKLVYTERDSLTHSSNERPNSNSPPTYEGPSWVLAEGAREKEDCFSDSRHVIHFRYEFSLSLSLSARIQSLKVSAARRLKRRQNGLI